MADPDFAIPSFVYEALNKHVPGLMREARRVILYPAGALTASLVRSGLLGGLTVVGIADRHPERFPDGFAGHAVSAADGIARGDANAVLVCSVSYHLEIVAQLTPLALSRGIDLIDLCASSPSGHSTEGQLGTLVGNLHRLEKMHTLMCQQEIRALLADPRFRDPRRLEPHGYKCYSQHDEDGMLAEIFRRLGSAVPRSFVEFGVGDGRENNTLLLLKQGWRGLWIEGSADNARLIRRDFEEYLVPRQLRLTEAFIDRDNINDLIGTAFEGEIGLLSVDIDSNDLYVWEAISVVRPSVVVVEYNAKFPPPLRWSVEYDPKGQWQLDDYMGASLAALYDLGRAKNYRLVGCNLNGTNAFFVHQDLVGEHFLVSDDPADHYHPARYFLTDGYKWMAGHPASPRPGRFW